MERWAQLSPDCYREAQDGGQVVVQETAQDAHARAEVTFQAPPGWRLVCLLNNAYAFDWLSERAAADGIVLACRPDGRWEAHIVECKATVKLNEWRHIRTRQFRGGRIRLDALCGVLGIQVDAVKVYTAYRKAAVGRETPNSVQLVHDVGRGASPGLADQRAWEAPDVEIADYGRVPHRRIELDVQDGVGRYTVALG